MRIYGVDFTCAPRKARPIRVAAGNRAQFNIFGLRIPF
jgi:hypothetical protein